MDSLSASLFPSPLLPTLQHTADLRSLLRSHSLPNRSDQWHFRSIIASSPSDVARYESDIDLLENLLDRLKSERAALQDYTVGCHSLFSPIRRLPNEVLTEIFALCAPELYPYYSSQGTVHSFKTSLERAAQVHLLRLSQVCCRWHEVVTCTPSLWATLEADFSVIRRKRDQDRFERLIQLSLQRSATCPLTIACRAGSGLQSGGPCLALMVQSSARWRCIDFNIQPSTSQLFSLAKGNLPLLERLRLRGSTQSKLDVFEIAPSLHYVRLEELAQAPPLLPWGQLGTFIYENMAGEDLISHGLPVMGRLSAFTSFTVQDLDISNLDLPTSGSSPVSFDIGYLRLGLLDHGDPKCSQGFLVVIMGMLILPRLKELFLEATVAESPLFWPQEQFLGLASRSSFDTTLTRLFLHDVVIAEGDLVECLSKLPLLLQLFIQDVVDGTYHTLITDSLLRRLTWTPNSDGLVPRINELNFTSIFTFDQHVWLDLVISRLTPGRTCGSPFNMDLHWHGGYEPDIDGEVETRLTQLEDQGEFVLWLNPDERAADA
ncbi:hypothetical protein C8R43DRAFT_1078061 [Mycena crocata]|nr:hypothetical protein C8R43DRAFT_1078061 [Mycena crocata]